MHIQNTYDDCRLYQARVKNGRETVSNRTSVSTQTGVLNVLHSIVQTQSKKFEDFAAQFLTVTKITMAQQISMRTFVGDGTR